VNALGGVCTGDGGSAWWRLPSCDVRVVLRLGFGRNRVRVHAQGQRKPRQGRRKAVQWCRVSATAEQWRARRRDTGAWCSGSVWGYTLSQQAQQVKGITVVLT
jgi:hypothetical protein